VLKNNKSTAFLIFLFILSSAFYSGCTGNYISPFTNSETPKDSIIIEDGAETTQNCTPVLIIYSENARYMSFSGDRESWTEWIEYDNSYTKFNIANGLYGTIFGSGIKTVYSRFKDSDGNIFPIDENTFDSIQYEMQNLHFLKITPRNITVSVGEEILFTLHGYDLGGKNEVPLEGSKITWTKRCGVGELNPIVGLSTTYTAPLVLGERDISSHYNNLGTGTTILVANSD